MGCKAFKDRGEVATNHWCTSRLSTDLIPRCKMHRPQVRARVEGEALQTTIGIGKSVQAHISMPGTTRTQVLQHQNPVKTQSPGRMAID